MGTTRAELAAILGAYGGTIDQVPQAPAYSLTHFDPPGPVAAAYLRSMGPIDAIMGPGGSGKTTASVFKPFRAIMGSMPPCRDGVVRAKITVLRDNYRALYRTTLQSFWQFFPPFMAGTEFFGGQDRPARQSIKALTVRNGRETPVELDIDFFAVGDIAIEQLLKAYETTLGVVDEADMLDPRVISFLYSRTGRYPSKALLPDGVPVPRWVALTFNPPAPHHELLKACERGTFQAQEDGSASGPKTINFFRQPSGLSPQAENRAGKSLEAYQAEADTLPEEDVRRFVHGLPGYPSDGKPVYGREFSSAVHVAPGPLAILPGVPLDIGFDQGLSPAAILMQTATTGQVRVLAEIVPEHGTGVARFLDQLLPLMMGRFCGLPPGLYGADPAGFYGADRIAGEMTWAEMVGKGLGRIILPAPSNEPIIRIEAVKLLLRTMIDATTPALIVDPCCRMLIEGFAAEYKYPKVKTGTGASIGDRPIKNAHANAHDALQYGVLVRRGRAGVIEDAARAGRPGNVTPFPPRGFASTADFNVFHV